MTLQMDDDVRRVAEFIQANVSPERRQIIAEWTAQLAPILWGNSDFGAGRALCLTHEQVD